MLKMKLVVLFSLSLYASPMTEPYRPVELAHAHEPLPVYHWWRLNDKGC
jgi:hypothetical protein